MKGPGIIMFVYGLVVLGGGIVAYSAAGSIASLVAGSGFGLGLLASGLGVSRGKKLGLLFAPFLALFLTAFFTYRFVQSGEFIPSGVMGVLGLVAVVLYFTLRR